MAITYSVWTLYAGKILQNPGVEETNHRLSGNYFRDQQRTITMIIRARRFATQDLNIAQVEDVLFEIILGCQPFDKSSHSIDDCRTNLVD
ncbi:hypothetical protein D9758_018939 [Tetrapyrgos nigripes]|uniref:Uncharacterized protein n=1 Tax=Tetrapyrgos nigripes TaxID=182062 RepID=A0A8H5EZM2_9AGAR|nr:hypothetical protein D9758_018939 [Tetrapyrgos nigripes]